VFFTGRSAALPRFAAVSIRLRAVPRQAVIVHPPGMLATAAVVFDDRASTGDHVLAPDESNESAPDAPGSVWHW
jgi:hypothetical protein